MDPDFDLVGSEPFWSDPDPINCPEPNPTIKRHKTRKKSKKLSINVPNLFHFYKIEIKKTYYLKALHFFIKDPELDPDL